MVVRRGGSLSEVFSKKHWGTLTLDGTTIGGRPINITLNPDGTVVHHDEGQHDEGQHVSMPLDSSPPPLPTQHVPPTQAVPSRTALPAMTILPKG